jgi:hypothetical protein
MDKPVQQEGNTHPDGETPPQVKEIRRQEIAAPPQRKARQIKRALHQARHLRDRDRGRASILRRNRKAFSARSSGFFMGLTPLGDPIGMWMKISGQEAQRVDISVR